MKESSIRLCINGKMLRYDVVQHTVLALTLEQAPPCPGCGGRTLAAMEYTQYGFWQDDETVYFVCDKCEIALIVQHVITGFEGDESQGASDEVHPN